MTAAVTIETLHLALGGEITNGKSGREILCAGPGHSSNDRSLAVMPADNLDGFIIHSFSDDDAIVCREYVRAKLGLPPFVPHKKNGNGSAGGDRWQILREHTYRDEEGEPYLRVRKLRRPDGETQYAQAHWEAGQWMKGKPKKKIPYRLPQLIAAPLTTTIYVVEGEKDADNLAKLGFTVTTASEGASAKWAPELTAYFKGRHVVVLPDADKVGRAHAEKAAKALDAITASIKAIDLYPDHDDGSDVSNWIESDPAGSRLAALVREAPAWAPSPDSDSGETDTTDEDALIAELAALPMLQYEKRREAAAKQLKMRVPVLDKLVEKARREALDEDESDQPVHWHVQPSSDPVATDDLLNELNSTYSRYAILPEHGAVAMALWALHAWAFDAAWISPFLMFVSPERRCGKTRAMTLLKWTCPRSELASNVSSSAIYRHIEACCPALLVDEAETHVDGNEAMRGILDAGHTKDAANVLRQVGSNYEKTKRFSVWAPKALASIGKLAATLQDRAIILSLKRKRRNQPVPRLKRDTVEFSVLRQKAKRWANDNKEALTDAQPSFPAELNDRACDNWEPLFAVADLAGGDWPAKARTAALVLSGDVVSTSEGTQLLAAMKGLRDTLGVDRITSDSLVEELVKDKDSLWAAYGKSGRAITQRQIATLLEPYGVRPDSIRIPGYGTKKGYLFAWLEEAFDTYIENGKKTPSDPEHRNKPRPTGTSDTFRSGTQGDVFRMENSEKPNNDGPCSGVPDRSTVFSQNACVCVSIAASRRTGAPKSASSAARTRCGCIQNAKARTSPRVRARPWQSGADVIFPGCATAIRCRRSPCPSTRSWPTPPSGLASPTSGPVGAITAITISGTRMAVELRARSPVGRHGATVSHAEDRRQDQRGSDPALPPR
jgi:Protein of unknown function (DUF3631)